MRLAAGTLACLLLLPGVARADAFDDLIRAQMEKRHVPGLAIAVVKDSAVLRVQGYGIANLEWETAVTPETVFGIGGLSTPFATAGVMLLVQGGAVRLESRIGTLLPGLPPAWSGVTVRQLLTQSSGIRSYSELPDFERRGRAPATHEEVLASVSGEPLLFAPGARFSPSDTNAYLLGMLIEKLSGTPYDLFLERKLGVPAGLAATRLDEAATIVPRRASGYVFTEAGFQKAPAADPSWAFAATGVLSTVRDLGKWASALRAGSLLSRPSQEAMWSPLGFAGGGRFPYGFGWHVEPYRGRRTVWQTGHASGFSSALLLCPDDGLAVVVLTNAATSSPLRVARAAASFFDKSLPTAERVGTRPDERLVKTEQIRKALEEVGRPELSRGELTPGLAAAITPEMRKSIARLLPTLRGLALVTCDPATEGTDVYGARIVRICTFRVDLGVSKLDVDFWLTADGKVGWIDVDTD